MFSDRGGAGHGLWALAQRLGEALLLILATALVAVSVFAALGWLPWPQIALSFGGEPVPAAGIWAQCGLTLFVLLLLFWLPANRRMARLEAGHRSFALGVEDVSRAYRLAHAADRTGVFSLSSEFESIRARMEHLRNHPDFAHLEPELLQLAAQMSHETRELARAYSDVKVSRARSFLQQRQEEVQGLTDRLALARATCDELRRWLIDVDHEERMAQTQLKRLEADLREILPGLGYSVDFEDRADSFPEGNVVALTKAQPEQRTPVRPERPDPRA